MGHHSSYVPETNAVRIVLLFNFLSLFLNSILLLCQAQLYLLLVYSSIKPKPFQNHSKANWTSTFGGQDETLSPTTMHQRLNNAPTTAFTLESFPNRDQSQAQNWKNGPQRFKLLQTHFTHFEYSFNLTNDKSDKRSTFQSPHHCSLVSQIWHSWDVRLKAKLKRSI